MKPEKVYAVPAYIDQIKLVSEHSRKMTTNYYYYFDTEKEANEFIIDLAKNAARLHEGYLLKAKKRLAKCEKKYA